MTTYVGGRRFEQKREFFEEELLYKEFSYQPPKPVVKRHVMVRNNAVYNHEPEPNFVSHVINNPAKKKEKKLVPVDTRKWMREGREIVAVGELIEVPNIPRKVKRVRESSDLVVNLVDEVDEVKYGSRDNKQVRRKIDNSSTLGKFRTGMPGRRKAITHDDIEYMEVRNAPRRIVQYRDKNPIAENNHTFIVSPIAHVEVNNKQRQKTTDDRAAMIRDYRSINRDKLANEEMEYKEVENKQREYKKSRRIAPKPQTEKHGEDDLVTQFKAGRAVRIMQKKLLKRGGLY